MRLFYLIICFIAPAFILGIQLCADEFDPGLFLSLHERNQLERMANEGDPKALTSLGYASMLGDGVPVSKDKAMFYFRLAAKKNAYAAFQLGNLLLESAATKSEVSEVIYYLQMASKMGDTSARQQMALMLIQGTAGDPDFEAGMAILRALASEGHASSAELIGDLLMQDTNITKNLLVEAFNSYLSAATMGSARAQLKVARMLKQGVGVDRDEAKARIYFEKAITSNSGVYLTESDKSLFGEEEQTKKRNSLAR